MNEMAHRLDGARARLQDEARQDDGRLLEVEDVAQLLGMTPDWIYRQVRANRLPHIRLGRYVRFRRDSIEAWLQSSERGTVSAR